MWIGLHIDSISSLSNIAAFSPVTSSARKVTVGLTFAIDGRLRSKSCAVGIMLADFPRATWIPLRSLAFEHAFEATPDRPALACTFSSAVIDQVLVVERFLERSSPGN